MQMSKVGFQAESSTLECLRDEFSGRRCVVAPTFLSPALARQAARDLESSEFNRATSDGLDGRRLATEMTISGSNVWVHALDLLLNDQRLFGAEYPGIFRGPTIIPIGTTILILRRPAWLASASTSALLLTLAVNS